MTAGSPDPLSTSWAELLREKRSLAAIVRDAGRLCIQDSVDVVLDVCNELANAHANGIVHGDLGLHRVRTIWPRRDGDLVEIWALDADDTGAIDFRAAFQAPALAPEQRVGKIGDIRSDIWAVGAILHALIGGAPPMGKRPVREMLPGAPRALITIVEQCLADDPAARPRSVDDVAGALASFASNPPERFQQLARRRIASLKAKHVPAKVTALTRLDEAAIKRESSSRILAVQPLPVPAPAAFAPAPVIPSSPTTAPLRGPLVPSYSDAQLPHQAPRLVGPETIGSTEWPQIHGAPSMSIAASSSALPAPQDMPTRAGRSGTLPELAPFAGHDASDEQLPPTMTAAALMPDPNVTLRMHQASMFPPSAAFPSAMPVAAPVEHMPSVTPPPVSVDPAGGPYAYESAPYIPPAPVAHRQRSYHPPSFGPMSIDMGANPDDLHFPQAARVPSFSDLAEYREAKRQSRRTGIMAVAAAAALIIVGFSYGGRVIKEDRDRAAAVQVQAPTEASPPVPATPAPKAAEVAPTKPAESAAPATSASASPSAKPSTKKSAPAAAPSPARREPKADKGSDIPKDPEFTPNGALSDGLGKKDSAPAGSLSDALK